MKNKMSLLQEGIIRYHEDNYKLWFYGNHGNQFTEKTKKKIDGFVNFANEEEKIKFYDTLEDYTGEYYWAGIIDGFRMCMGLMKELEQFESPHFLRDLLMDREI